MLANKSQSGSRRRILVVCFADSTHSQAWLDLMRDTEFDVRVFASPIEYGGLYPPRSWTFPTYVLARPSRPRVAKQIKWLLPGAPWLHSLLKLEQHRFSLASRWLRWIILTWRPDIVHTLRLNPEGWLTWQALQHIPATRRPKWVVSCWGSDLSVEVDLPGIRDHTELVLKNCDGFLAGCPLDFRLALAAGLEASKVAFKEPVPNTGGLDLGSFGAPGSSDGTRKLIVIPKAYEGPYNKTVPILEALRLAEDALIGYEVHLLMCSWEVQMWLGRMPESLRRQCHYYGMLPQRDLFEMLGRARVMIATSLSDGTPNVMLEAMAAGALPVMSPLESIQEWIEDGHNGLLAPALYPDQIAAALRRALTDDELWHAARQVNWQLVSRRADRTRIRPQVLDYYRTLLEG
jgi:glycosyltransferase involved in cell wall biosynthesis